MEAGKLKQRLVGAAVLVSVVVIVLSLTLQMPEESASGFEDDVIPPKAAGLSVKVLPLDIPQRVEPSMTAPESEPEPVSAAADSVTTTAPPSAGETAGPVAPEASAAGPTSPAVVDAPANEVPAATKAPVPEPPAPSAAKPAAGAPAAWVVQLGSFSSQENAFALRDKLRKRRYTAFVDDVPGPGKKRVYRVRVGPELLRSRADTLRVQLEKEFKLKGIVVAHEVN